MIRMICLIAFLFTWGNSIACDLCNCYFNINPHDYRNAIGFRYRYSPYHRSGEREIFSTYELWGRWYPVSKVQIDAVIPFRHNVMKEGGSHEINGLGDIVIMAQYELFSNFPKGEHPFRQRLYMGGGVKCPTGKYKASFDNEPIDQHIQTGSGSTDFILSSTYMAKYNLTGLNVNATYGLNTTNSYGFKFSNRLNIASSVFFQNNLGNIILMPNAGLYYEQASRDILNQTNLPNTGGKILLGTLGVDVFTGNYAITIAYQKPFLQNVGSNQTKNQYRFVLGLHYSFDSKMKMF